MRLGNVIRQVFLGELLFHFCYTFLYYYKLSRQVTQNNTHQALTLGDSCQKTFLYYYKLSRQVTQNNTHQALTLGDSCQK